MRENSGWRSMGDGAVGGAQKFDSLLQWHREHHACLCDRLEFRADERPPNCQVRHDVGAAADARDSGRRSAPVSALLSMGHNSSPSPRCSWQEKQKQLKSSGADTFRIHREGCVGIKITPGKMPADRLSVYTEGSRADFAGIRDLNPRRQASNIAPGKPGDSKRGIVTEFSAKSRRRLQRQLATMRKAEVAYTMALTLPGCDVETFDHSEVMEAFTKVLRRLSVKTRFSGVTGYWKRELQKRGALHYHLLLYGLENDELKAEFQAWMVAQWTSFFSSRLTDEQRERHRWWHSRADNMQLVQNFSAYFSKYLGKDEDAAGGVAGRWWGSFNKRALPVSIRAEAETRDKATVMLHRLARKRRQKMMDAGKHRADAARLEKFGLRNFTQNALTRLRSGYDMRGYRNPQRANFQLACYGEIWKANGIRPGKSRFRGKVPKTAPIILCDASAPAFAAKALEFVNRSLGLNIQLEEVLNRREFIPDPLKPVPPGRTPRNPERIRLQSDFFGDCEL